MGNDRRVAVFAFGTRGDVLPVAVVAAALARADPSSSITFITHEAHRNLEPHLARSGVARFVAVSAPPVVPGRAWEDDEKVAREVQIREECIAAMDSVMMGEGGGVIINLFALEGWHLAELYRVPCAVLAPYVVPYSAPSAFERRFRLAHPLLYRRLKEAAPGEVGWEEVTHWMWPLFTDRWASWRTHRLHLSACPLTDPVTDLPLMHEWPRASPLLYGFSPQVVECPAYWPRSVSVCGFWFAPLEWEVRDVHSEFRAPQAKGSSNPREVLLDPVGRHSLLHTSFCIKSSMQMGRNIDVLDIQSRAKHNPLQTKSGTSDLGDPRSVGEDGGYDSGPSSFPTAMCHVAMEATREGYVVVKPQDSRELTEVLNERARSLQVDENSQLDAFIDNVTKMSYKPPVKLCRFMSENRDYRPIFVGLSSMGSMGFLESPGSILDLLGAVLNATNSYAILLTAGHAPLDLAVSEQCDDRLAIQCLDAEQKRNLLGEGLCCFNSRLFCYSGSIPYAWLLPQCSVAIHHGGSGTTAACLRAGIPQIICPFVLDQFYWAERMKWLGVAPQPLMAQHLMPASEGFVDAVKVITAAISEAFSVELKRCACALSAKIEGEDGTAVAVGILRAALCR